jgi:RNA 2',3'-cyclic 3'-phosphodiesterase
VRLFVALEIPPAVRENFAALIEKLHAIASQGGDKRPRWVRPENLHVTLKFIGQLPEGKLGDMHNALASVGNALATARSASAVEMNFRGLGFFPSDKRPRVFWAGLEASPNLPALAREVDRATATQGVAQETREFTPHLTLARFEPPGLNETLRAAIQKNADLDFGSFQTAEFHLIESKTKPSVAEYTRLATFRFATENSR